MTAPWLIGQHKGVRGWWPDTPTPCPHVQLSLDFPELEYPNPRTVFLGDGVMKGSLFTTNRSITL